MLAYQAVWHLHEMACVAVPLLCWQQLVARVLVVLSVQIFALVLADVALHSRLLEKHRLTQHSPSPFSVWCEQL